jgi:hypothetical protein
MNQQDIETYARVHSAVEDLADLYISHFGTGGREYVSSFEVDLDGSIHIGAEESHCGCCGPDYNSYNIPLSYLTDDDWVNTEKKSRAKKKQKLEKDRAAKAVIRKKEKAIKDAAKKKRLEAERYQEFLEMKKEYESK